MFAIVHNSSSCPCLCVQSSDWNSDLLCGWRCVHVSGEGSTRGGGNTKLHFLEGHPFPNQGTLLLMEKAGTTVQCSLIIVNSRGPPKIVCCNRSSN